MKLNEGSKRHYSVSVFEGMKKGAGLPTPSPVFREGVFPLLLLLSLSCVFLFVLSPLSAWAAVPIAPSGLTATALSRTQIRIDWTDNSGDETLFYIERKIGATGAYTQLTYVGTNITTYTNASLIQNTEYYYRVRAYNASGYSAYSNEASATTLPLYAPSDLSASSGAYTTANLVWTDNSADESGFKIERKTGVEGTYALVTTLGANVTSYANTGLTQGTEYYYRVRAYNGSYYSDYSNEVNVTTSTFPSPAGLEATPLSSTQIKLTWTDNSSDETRFYIEYKTTGSYTALTNVTPNTTTYTHTNLTQGTTYSYRVRAYNSTTGAYSAYSNEASATTLTLNAPTNLSISAASYTQVTLTWTDNTNDETSFYIERKTGTGGTYVQIATVGANINSYTNTGLTQGTEYYYRVRAYTNANYSDYSNEANATTLTLNAPSNLTATPLSATQIRLDWTDNSTDETNFYIERKTGSGGTYAYIGNVGANITTYTGAGLTQNTTYYYRVRAYNPGNYSAYSNEASASTSALSVPTDLAVSSAAYTNVTITWTDNSADEGGFKIERKTGVGGTYAQITTVGANVTSFTSSGLTQGTEYYFRVRAYSGTNNSDYSNEVKVTTPIFLSPTGLEATPLSSKEIKLTWADNSSDETSFYIERKTVVAGTYAVIDTVGANVTTYSNTGLDVNTEYYYLVRAYGPVGYSAYSNEASAVTLTFNAPSNLMASPLSSSEIKLTWKDNSTDEISFRIERKTGVDGTYTQIGSVGVNVMAYSSTTLDPDEEYYYRVRAYNGGGYSAYSNEASAITPGCTQEGYYQP